MVFAARQGARLFRLRHVVPSSIIGTSPIRMMSLRESVISLIVTLLTFVPFVEPDHGSRIGVILLDLTVRT
jgi:hypothetical protein